MTRRTSIPEKDWFEWHEQQTDPASTPARRLAAVQNALRQVIDQLPPGPFVVVSLCAGQAADILGVLDGHPRRDDADITLVELDPRNVGFALAHARDADVRRVRAVTGDAGLSDSLVGVPRAQVLLLIGMVTHITEEDFARLIGELPRICARDAIVVWNRRLHLDTLASTRRARRAFKRAGFDPVRLDAASEHDREVRVFAERFTGAPQPFQPGVRYFTFAWSPHPRRMLRRIDDRATRLLRSARGARERRTTTPGS